MESILTSIKKLLGIAEEYTHFDEDLIMHINSVLTILTQMGIGPSTGYIITSKDDTWDEFIDNKIYLEAVKTYIHLKVKLVFDPPLSSAVTEAMNKMITELEWRLYAAAETKSLQGEGLIQNGRKHYLRRRSPALGYKRSEVGAKTLSEQRWFPYSSR